MSLFSQYGAEFLTMALAHLIAVASPGPDFAIVMKHSIHYGKRIAIITSLGIGVAILLHVTYALAGIGLIIHSTPWLYDALIITAAGFLVYLGYGAVRSQPHSTGEAGRNSNYEISGKRAFSLGFLTNGLNPKATLFFLSLFTVIVDPSTPFHVKGFYGVYLAIATFVWFFTLSMILTNSKVQSIFNKKAHLFDRFMGWVLILLAINILISEFIIQ